MASLLHRSVNPLSSDGLYPETALMRGETADLWDLIVETLKPETNNECKYLDSTALETSSNVSP